MHLHWLCVTTVKKILDVCWITLQTLLIPCCASSDVIRQIPSCKRRVFSWPIFFLLLLFPFSGVAVDLFAGKFSPCDIRVLPGHRQRVLSLGICLLSCWIHECHRGLGLVMQIMTLYLPRRDRLGRDQLQISSCLELTPWEGCLLPAVGAVNPYLFSATERGRAAAAGNANLPRGEIPLLPADAGKGKGLAPCAWLSYSGLGIAPGELQTGKLVKSAGLI